MAPPRSAKEKWKVTYAWQDSGVAAASTEVDAEQLLNNGVEVAIDFESHTTGADGMHLIHLISRAKRQHILQTRFVSNVTPCLVSN